MPLAAPSPAIGGHVDIDGPLMQDRCQDCPNQGGGAPEQHDFHDQAAWLQQQIQGNG